MDAEDKQARRVFFSKLPDQRKSLSSLVFFFLSLLHVGFSLRRHDLKSETQATAPPAVAALRGGGWGFPGRRSLYSTRPFPRR